MISSPLSYRDVKAHGIVRNPVPGGNTRRNNNIHLAWYGHVGRLFVMPMFTNNIDACIASCDAGTCKFIIIELSVFAPEVGHANFIIIHDKVAYRIEPHGHNHSVVNSTAEMEVALVELFDRYNVIYVPHTYQLIPGPKDQQYIGLQSLGEVNKPVVEDTLLNARIAYAPGLCATFTLLYIEKICEFSMSRIGSKLRQLKLFSGALQKIDRKKVLAEADKHTYKGALLSNQRILQFETSVYAQLLELIPMIPGSSGVTTRHNKEVHSSRLRDQRSKLKKEHFDKSRHQLDVDMFDTIVRVLTSWDSIPLDPPFDILDIYGINFKKLISNMGGLRKKKQKKKKKKDKKTRRRKKH